MPENLPRHWLPALVHPFAWRMAWRDSRSQRRRLALFALSIVAGISALVAIHLLRASLQGGLESQAKALLGADLHISSREPFKPEGTAALTGKATRVACETGFSSMLYFPTADSARLVMVRGLEGDYPFYGKVQTSPPDAWERLHHESGILLEPALLDQFNARLGDKVKLGSLELSILGTVTKSPPHSSRFGGFAPEVFVRLADLDRTGLLSRSSLAFFHLYLELPHPEADAREIRRTNTDTLWRFETPVDRREALGEALDHAEQFLGLVALVTLVLGALGVAGAIHAHVSRRLQSVAILRCLGCPGDLAFSVYVIQAAALGLAGAILGALVGVSLHAIILGLFRHSLPVEIDAAPSWLVVARTTAAGFLVCCGFALFPLLRVRAVPPAATLRESIPTQSVRRVWPLWLSLGLLLTVLNLERGAHWLRAFSFTGALVFAFLLLAGAARLLSAIARRLPRPAWPYLLRQGIANLHRPRNQTLLFLLSLGLGTFLLLTILLAKNLLLDQVNLHRLSESPNIYLVDVQADQIDGVTQLVRAQGLPILEQAPMVTMRIQSVRGVPVRELEKRNEIPKWALQREFRSTWRDHLNSTEKLAAGTWFPAHLDPAAPTPLSLEKELAKDLHVSVGDDLVMDVQGIAIPARVTSLREVDWSRFNLNFFMVFPPGVLEGAPGFQVLTTRIPEGTSSGQLQRVLVKQFPNVTAIDLTLILANIRSILEQVARVVTVLAGFTVLAALPILIGTLWNGRAQRLQESVLLRTLGASARQIRVILVIEYATLGLLSALTGLLLALAANAALAHWVFKGSPWPDPALVLSTFAAATALALLAGLALSRGVSRHPPLAILRGE